MATTHYPFLCIGGGLASASAIQTLISEGVSGSDIGLVALEPELPYNRPPLSKGFLAGRETRESIVIEPQAFYADHGVTVKLATEVVSLTPKALELTTDKREQLTFDCALIATGSRPRRLGVPGADLANIFTLRTVADSEAIQAAAKEAKQAVIVGAGFIGLETAATLTGLGVKVTILHRGGHLLDRFATPEMAKFFDDYCTAQGVGFRYETTVDHFEGVDGRVVQVITDTNQTLPADLVIVGIGVDLNLDFVKDQALRIENGLVVDEQLETSVPGIFAAGDIANFPDVMFGGTRRRIEHWDHAIATGQHAARNMLGTSQDFRHLSYFFSDMFDLSFELWGDTDNPATVVFTGSVAEKTAAAWYLRAGKLAAYLAMNRPEAEKKQAETWLTTGGLVKPADLEPFK